VQCSDRQSMGGGRECEAGRLQFWCEWGRSRVSRFGLVLERGGGSSEGLSLQPIMFFWCGASSKLLHS
jgi:hypothetical protein